MRATGRGGVIAMRGYRYPTNTYHPPFHGKRNTARENCQLSGLITFRPLSDFSGVSELMSEKSLYRPALPYLEGIQPRGGDMSDSPPVVFG